MPKYVVIDNSWNRLTYGDLVGKTLTKPPEERNAPADCLQITTNNVPRDILDGFELTPKEREEFDYINWDAIERGEDSASFFRYKGEVYDLGEFTTWNNPSSPMTGWDGMQSDTFFSGILVRYTDDFERVVVGRYYS